MGRALALAAALVLSLAIAPRAAYAATPPFMWLPVDNGNITYYVNDAWTLRNGLPTYSCCPVEVPDGSGTYKHTGTDYPGPPNGAIYAAARGTVTVATDGLPDGCDKRASDNTGNAVWIRHDNGWTTVYSHMAKGSVLPRVGDVVEAGQRIGGIGNSGNTFGGACGGVHLHFEVRDAAFRVNNPYNRDTGYMWVTDPPRPAPADLCGTPGAPSDVSYLPNITKTLGGPDGWVTPFFVQNTGDASATLEVSYYRFSDGQLVRCRKALGLQPARTHAVNPNEDPDLPDNTQFAVVVRSWGSTIGVAVNQLRGSGASTLAASYVGFNSGATRVYLPNVTRRFYGYDVPFIIQNLGTVPANVSARFVSFDGTRTHTVPLTILSGRSGVIDPDATPGLVDGTQYAVTITSDQPVGVVANAYNLSGAPVAYTHTGLATGATTVYAPYAAKTTRVSPVVVQNLGSAATDATLTFTPLGGGAPQTFTLTGIAAGASRAFDPRFTLGTTTPCGVASATCLGSGEYSVRVNASQPVAAVVLPTSATTAAAYGGQAAPTTRSYLPVIRRNVGGAGGWTSEIYVQSVTAIGATLRFYRFGDGALSAQHPVTLYGGGAARVDPRQVAGLADDTRYALEIVGNATIAAIAYELGPEGDSAMTFEGMTK